MVPRSLARAQVRQHSRKVCGSRLKRPKQAQLLHFWATWYAVFLPLRLDLSTRNSGHCRLGWSPGLSREPRPDRTPEANALCRSNWHTWPNGSTLTLTDRPETRSVAGSGGPVVTRASPGQTAQQKGMRFALEKTKTSPISSLLGHLVRSFSTP